VDLTVDHENGIMSQATKIVLATVGISAVLALALLAQIVLTG
jgi:uncharacterized membrane protein YuzA (DUF378 family)